jgi:Fur family ferric uptake transcriptional regulator
MISIEKLHAHLAGVGRSRTAARDQVYLALDALGPCTKHELALQLAGAIDESSVYRTVNLFIQIGVADMIRFHLIELSDRFKQHHHHFVCNSCGREVGFHDERLEQLLVQLTSARNLQLIDHQVELAGLCEDCASS